jgi:hypothetical protein
LFLLNFLFYYFKIKLLKTKNNCSLDNNNIRHATTYKIRKYYWLAKNNDTALMEALSLYGPIPVGINSSAPGFDVYSSGIYANSPGYCGTNIGYKNFIL